MDSRHFIGVVLMVVIIIMATGCEIGKNVRYGQLVTAIQLSEEATLDCSIEPLFYTDEWTRKVLLNLELYVLSARGSHKATIELHFDLLRQYTRDGSTCNNVGLIHDELTSIYDELPL